ncbi:MAG: DUF6328 family protein [Pseudonocardiaceae bacterium]
MRSGDPPRPWPDPVADNRARTDTDEWNLSVRGEQPKQRADRNFVELLQELRVMQTGVQVLFAMLLTVSFTTMFDRTSAFLRIVYVITLVSCAVAAALLMAPVAYHRRLFQRGRKSDLVAVTHRLLQAGMLMLVVAMAGALLLVVDQVLGWVAGVLVSSLVGLIFVLLWFVLPTWARGHSRGAPS